MHGEDTHVVVFYAAQTLIITLSSPAGNGILARWDFGCKPSYNPATVRCHTSYGMRAVLVAKPDACCVCTK